MLLEMKGKGWFPKEGSVLSASECELPPPDTIPLSLLITAAICLLLFVVVEVRSEEERISYRLSQCNHSQFQDFRKKGDRCEKIFSLSLSISIVHILKHEQCDSEKRWY